MLKIKGKLIFIKQNEAKDYEGKITPPSQTLQLQIIDPEKGFDIVNVKDKNFKYSKADLEKEIDVSLSAYSQTGIYYSVA